MRRVVACASLILMLCASVGWGRGGPPPVRWWDEGSGSAVAQTAPSPAIRQFPTVEIDPLISYIRYLFMHKQALILEQDGEFYFYFAYNDAQTHVTTKVFAESDLLNPGAWISQNVVTWTGAGTLRYVSPTAYWDSGASLWYPQVTFNAYGPTATFCMHDQGGLGAGLWTAPMDVSGPVYDYYLPLTETSTSNVVFMEGLARDTASDSHVFKSFGGVDGVMVDPPGEVMVFPTDASWGPNPVYGQGFENSQLLHHDGRVVIARGGYRSEDYADHTNPLLVVYRESIDGGLSWSDNVWLDQVTVPDIPGGLPGIEGHYQNSFFDGLIEADGDLHFLCVVA
ncbi:MAG: hypothetical protein MUE60_01900, partial [Candidatus Eisenbacteria bacterium]|nr:hypothetical protein [Candidatus Eisenbacteria bacterium]